jgi:hypothetical protein
MTADGVDIFAGTYGVLSFFGTNLFAGTPSGVFLSTNNGDTWSDAGSGLPNNPEVLSLTCDSSYLYAGLYYGGIWKRPLSEMVTDVSEITGKGTPCHFSLEQNYPNPFNPRTTIRFSILRSSLTTLRVYNVLAEEVASLMSADLSPGSYQIDWDAPDLPGGIYFCRLQAGTVTETRKLLLLK